MGAPPSGTPTGGPGGGGGGGGHEAPTDETRYLRGTQLTGSNGVVEFTPVFPGWYRGRCVHIHTKVHVGGTMTSSGYEGGSTCHTGHLSFREDAVLDAAAVAPYSTSTTERTTLDQDAIYPGNGAEGGLLTSGTRRGGSRTGGRHSHDGRRPGRHPHRDRRLSRRRARAFGSAPVRVGARRRRAVVSPPRCRGRDRQRLPLRGPFREGGLPQTGVEGAVAAARLIRSRS